MHPGIFFLSLSPAADPPVIPADEEDCYEGNGSSYRSITSETISAPRFLTDIAQLQWSILMRKHHTFKIQQAHIQPQELSGFKDETGFTH